MPWHMLYFSDIQSATVPDQLFTFANAYLESATLLCTSLCNSKDGANYAHGAVIMSLTFHALELFLKAAILRKVPAESFGGRAGHDLDLLKNRYANLYPNKAMQFNIPFKRELPDTEELLKHVREQNKAMPEDQLHRYPINVKGKEWEAMLAFEPHSFSETLRTLKHELAVVKLLMVSC